MKTPKELASDCGQEGVESLELTFADVQKEAAADECACCKALLDGIADILQNQTTNRSPLQAYGLTQSTHMRAAAKVLRSVATSLRVRELKIREGKL